MEFEKHEWAHLHDVVLDTTGKSLKQLELEALYNTLPEYLQEDAVHWGLNDSVVRDNIYEYLEKQQ